MRGWYVRAERVNVQVDEQHSWSNSSACFLIASSLERPNHDTRYYTLQTQRHLVSSSLVAVNSHRKTKNVMCGAGRRREIMIA